MDWAEGVIIEQASLRALANGTTSDGVFEMIKEVRKVCKVPLAIMTYANVVFGYGTERFLQNAKECDICCMILPDIPFEERDEMLGYFKEVDITLISMITPTSKDRIRMIAKEAEGFIYCVSSLGVTGERSEFNAGIQMMIEEVKATKDVPCAIGFGISNPEQAKEMSQYADGVIVGSAIVKIVGEYGKDAVEPVSQYVKEMVAAIR